MNKNETVEKITEYLVNNHKDYILFVTLVGSAAHNAMYEGISDIDFLFITEGLSYERNEEIMRFIRKNFTDFKIDVTFTSKKETMNCNCLNNKAMQGLYLVQKGVTKSLYHNPDFTYFIDENIIKNTSPIICLVEVSEIIRNVADFDNWPDKENGQRKILKTVYYALKKYFVTLDLFPKNVNDCLEILNNMSSITLDLDAAKVLHKQITESEDFEKLKRFSFKVAEFLLEKLNERSYSQSTSEDIRIKVNDVTYKVRAGGLVQYKDKFLMVKMGLGSYWCVPGGHLEWFENSEHAVIREVEEETNMSVMVKHLFLLHENFYYNVKNQKFHEMCFYYLLQPKNEKEVIKDQIREEFDKGKKDVLEFKWFTKEEIANLDIKPVIIKDMIVSGRVNHMNHEIKRNIND